MSLLVLSILALSVFAGPCSFAKNLLVAEPSSLVNSTSFVQKDTELSSSALEKKSESPSWFLSQSANDQKWAVFPVYAHNSTDGHIFGGRGFVYPTGDTGYYSSIEALVSEKFFLSFAFSYQYWRKNGDQLKVKTLYDGFSEPYYGEGFRTRVEDRKDILVDKLFLQTEYITLFRSHLYGGAFLRLDYRREKYSQENALPKKAKFSTSPLMSGGLLLRYDSRDHQFNPSRGEYYQIRFWLNSRLPSPLFLEGELRFFFSPWKSLVLALRGMGGMAFLNSPGYLSRFSLGGPNWLRGYRRNRFRGEKFYMSQTELRYTPWRFLTFTTFFDFGSAGDHFPLLPRYAFGGGLRFGLPPTYDKKIRVEVGVGEDQYNVVVFFLHPF